MHTLNATSIRIPMTFFAEPEKNLKIHMQTQKTFNIQTNPKQKEQCWMPYSTPNYTTEP